MCVLIGCKLTCEPRPLVGETEAEVSDEQWTLRKNDFVQVLLVLAANQHGIEMWQWRL